jgi:hypothetical protein
MCRANKATIVVGAVLVVGVLAHDYYDLRDMADLSQQSSLRLYGEGIYEYHALTGKWPSKIDDLAGTSLPRRYPHWWADQLGLDADVIVAPQDLNPDPNENGHVILCYHNKGLDAENGRMWICWGDLQTGCITLEELQEHLKKQKIVELLASSGD